MCTHRKIQTLIRPSRPPTPSHAHSRPRPLPHSLLSAPRPSLCDSARGLLPSSSSAAAPPLLPLPLHRPGGRGPSPSPPTPDPSPSSPFTRAAHPDPSPPPTTEQIRTLPILLPRRCPSVDGEPYGPPIDRTIGKWTLVTRPTAQSPRITRSKATCKTKTPIQTIQGPVRVPHPLHKRRPMDQCSKHRMLPAGTGSDYRRSSSN